MTTEGSSARKVLFLFQVVVAFTILYELSSTSNSHVRYTIYAAISSSSSSSMTPIMHQLIQNDDNLPMTPTTTGMHLSLISTDPK
jgi:hypothetical protein